MFTIKKPPVAQDSTNWHQPLLFSTHMTITQCKGKIALLEQSKKQGMKLSLISPDDDRLEFYATDGSLAHFWGVLTKGQHEMKVYGTMGVKIWGGSMISIGTFLTLSTFLRLPVYQRTVSNFIFISAMMSIFIIFATMIMALFARSNLKKSIKQFFDAT